MIKSPLSTRKRTIDQEINELLPLSNAATDYLGRRYMKRITQNGVVTKHERSTTGTTCRSQPTTRNARRTRPCGTSCGTRRNPSPDGGQLVCLRLGLDQKRDGTLQEQRNHREFLLLRPLRRSHAKGQHHQSPSMEQRDVRRRIRACLLQLPPL